MRHVYMIRGFAACARCHRLPLAPLRFNRRFIYFVYFSGNVTKIGLTTARIMLQYVTLELYRIYVENIRKQAQLEMFLKKVLTLLTHPRVPKWLLSMYTYTPYVRTIRIQNQGEQHGNVLQINREINSDYIWYKRRSGGSRVSTHICTKPTQPQKTFAENTSLFMRVRKKNGKINA